MTAVLRIFLSATSADLGPAREAAKRALLTMGYFPVEQAHFGPAPETLLQLLRRKIEESDAVLHLVGECSGAEPPRAIEEAGKSEDSHPPIVHAMGISFRAGAGEAALRLCLWQGFSLPKTRAGN